MGALICFYVNGTLHQQDVKMVVRLGTILSILLAPKSECLMLMLTLPTLQQTVL